jgi:hypothetical protein
MRAPHKNPPPLRSGGQLLSRTERHLGISPLSEDQARTAQHGQLIDRYGHVHSEAVLVNWSPAALSIHRIGDEPKAGG